MSPISDIILHGTWIREESSERGSFLIWGERRFPEVLTKPRGRQPKILRHPYAASPKDIREVLHALSESLMLDENEPDVSDGKAVLSLPVVGRIPIPSQQTVVELEGKPRIADCRIDIVCMPAVDGLGFFSAIPLRGYDLPCRIGADIRFWSAAVKFAFHLISQHKFIPMLYEKGYKKGKDEFVAYWEPVLDAPSDAEKLEKLIRVMPDACRSVKSATCVKNSTKLSEPHPRRLILDFLNDSIDTWIRSHAGRSLISGIPESLGDRAVIRWLQALTDPDKTFQANKVLESGLKRLCTSLNDWRNAGVAPRDHPGKFRTCFRLEPPEDGDMKARR